MIPHHPPSRRWSTRIMRATAAVAIPAALIVASGQALAAPTDDWNSYDFNIAQSGYNGAESTVSASTVSSLVTKWTHNSSKSVSAQPTESNGIVYWGTWDGVEHAYTLSGTKVWEDSLAVTSHSGCNPGSVGVADSAAVATVNGTRDIFVGSGNKMYGINAATGKILWSHTMGPSGVETMYSSPDYYNGSIYVGTASLADCPLNQGQMVKLSAATGAVQGTTNIVANGCIGGGIWGSASIQSSTGMLYVGTGTWHSCGTSEVNAGALLEINTSNMSVVQRWQLPGREIQTSDIEFGSAPTLMDFTSGGTTYHRLVIGAKDGNLYAFDQAHISNGPVWTDGFDKGGTGPQGGEGILAPAAFNGSTLYEAAGITTINGSSCKGSVRSINPVTGKYNWQDCLGAPVLGSVTLIPGVVIVAEGSHVDFKSSSNGATLHTFTDSTSGSTFYSAASVARGMVFVGNMDGHFWAFAPPTSGGGGGGTGHTYVGAASGKCIDDPGGSTTNTTQMEIWTCNGGANQSLVASGGTLQVEGKCLNASGAGTANNTPIIIYTCSTTAANEQFAYNSSNGTIVGSQSGKCITVQSAATTNGSKLILYTCNGGTNQKWTQK